MISRVVVGVTGATGAVYAVRLLQRLKAVGQETHLVASPAGVLNVHHELGLDRHDLEALADHAYSPADIGAAIASGSFETSSMVVAPCSMRTLAAIALGLSDNLLTRAADVTLKERRRLVLMVRETPFNLAHLRNMTSVTEMGGGDLPAAPGFLSSASNHRRTRRRNGRTSAVADRRRRRCAEELARPLMSAGLTQVGKAL